MKTFVVSLASFALGGVVVAVLLWSTWPTEECAKVLALDGTEHQVLKQTIANQTAVVELKDRQYQKLLANYDASIQAKSEVEREVEKIKARATQQSRVETLWKETTGYALFGAIAPPVAGTVSKLASAIKWLPGK